MAHTFVFLIHNSLTRFECRLGTGNDRNRQDPFPNDTGMMCSRCQFLSDVAALMEVDPVQVVDVVLEGEAFAEWDLISSFTDTLIKK